MYGARGALIASQEANSHRVFVGEMRLLADNTPSVFRWLDSSPSDREMYLYVLCLAKQGQRRWTLHAFGVGQGGDQTAEPLCVIRGSTGAAARV
jgi:hypothetical protein